MTYRFRPVFDRRDLAAIAPTLLEQPDQKSLPPSVGRFRFKLVHAGRMAGKKKQIEAFMSSSGDGTEKDSDGVAQRIAHPVADREAEGSSPSTVTSTAEDENGNMIETVTRAGRVVSRRIV